jgi:hypothetical protein
MLPPQERLAESASFIKSLNVDHVVLLETLAQNMTPPVHTLWNHEHHLCTEGGLMLSSNTEIRNPRLWKEGMLRGVLQIQLVPCSLLVAHIPPAKYAPEQIELRGFLYSILMLLRQNIPLLLVCDLNRDSASHWVQTLLGLGLTLIIPQEGHDYVFSSPDLVNRLSLSIYDDLEYLSDHKPIVIQLK